MRGQVEAEEVGGSVSGGFRHDAAIRNGVSVALLGVVGVRFDAEPGDAGAELSGGQPGRLDRDEPVDFLGNRVGEMRGAVIDCFGAAQVDRSGGEEPPRMGETPLQIDRHRQLDICSAAGQPQRHPDLGCGGFPGAARVVLDLEHVV